MTGLGPTKLISPRRTLKIWGSSSRLVLRRNFPTLVTRGSFSSFCFSSNSFLRSGLSSRTFSSLASAPSTIVLNFRIRKGLFPGPMRICEKKTGPGESMITKRPMIPMSGTRGMHNTPASRISEAFLTQRFARDFRLLWIPSKKISS